jgi:DNA-binding SARP family transcriptional activator
VRQGVSGPVEFGILGPLEVVGRDGPVTVRGTKRRGLLAHLVVHAGEAVSLDRLVDDLWDQRPSSGARGTVQSYLSGLRKLFADNDDVMLETRGGGYALLVRPDSVDAARFETLCVQAGAEQRAAQRMRSLDAALALWRGAPLGEFAGSAWADVEATRLEALHLQALQQRVEAQLALGGHEEAIPELERLVRDHPLDERFWGQMIVAYYRGGRQADALRAYQQVRSTLTEELGVEPGAALSELERRVLDHDPALMVSPEAAPGVVGMPLPPRLWLEGLFVGREVECERLDGALEAVRADNGRRVVLVAGEPGIGKTTLVARFARAAHDADAVVLYGRCDEGLGIPYQPWVEALGHLVRHLAEDTLGAHVKLRGGELARLVPELVQRVGAAAPAASSDPEMDRYLLFGAVVDLLARASHDAPVMLVLEDLHWADLPTLQLLRHVVGDVSMHLLVVATYRGSDIGDHPLAATLADLYREPGVERITLGGLDLDALGALVEAARGYELDKAGLRLRDALAAETDGNPFFVTEVLRDLVEAGAPRSGEGNREVGSPDTLLRVPASIRDVIIQRVTRLGAETRELLSVAAVVGRDFDVDVLADAAGFDELTVLDVLDAGTGAALVRPAVADADRYTFVHALIAHAIVEALSPARRRRAHARIAAALDARFGDKPGDRIGELARHWLAAREDPMKAIDHASQAGDYALAQLAPDEALRWYRQALDVLDQSAGPDDARRGNLLVGLGQAQRQTGDPAHRETLLAAAQLAQRLNDTELLVRAAVANSRGTSSAIYGTDAERVEVLEAARTATEGQSTPGRAKVLATLAAELAFSDRTHMHVVAGEAIALAKRLDDPTFVTVATRLEMPLRTPDTLAQRVALGAEATTAAERTADPVLRWLAANINYTPALETGDGEAFRTHVEVVDRLAHQNGQPHMLWVSALARSLGASVDGQLDRAEQFAAEALEIGMNNGQADASFVYGGQLIAIRFDQGRLDELSDLVEQSAAAIPGGEGRVIRALYYSEVGRPGDAGRLIEMDAANGFSAFSFDVTWTSCMAIYAQVAATVRNQRAAARLVEQIEPWRDQIATSGTSIWNGSIAHGLGLALATILHYDDAEEAFAEAAAAHERMRAPLLLARTRLEWARLLRRRDGEGDGERARELAHAAHAVAAELGAGSIERGAGELLDSLGSSGGSAP